MTMISSPSLIYPLSRAAACTNLSSPEGVRGQQVSDWLFNGASAAEGGRSFAIGRDGKAHVVGSLWSCAWHWKVTKVNGLDGRFGTPLRFQRQDYPVC